MARSAVCATVPRRFRMGGRAAAAFGTLALAFHLAPLAAADAGENSALARIQQRGTLTVALYRDFAPFSDKGQGIDVELAQALAAKLGVKMSPLWFTAGERVEDDLRKMVWLGTPIGYGPADVMMHVPVDRNFMARAKQVNIFAPYHRERFAIGRQLEKLPTLDSLEPFEKLSLAVEGDSMGALVMSSADNGRYREKLKIFKNAEEAIEALKSGTAVAALAQQGELEGILGDDSRFAIDLPPHPVLRLRQWMLGLAVKAESEDVAKALEGAMNELLADGTVKSIMQRHGVKHRQP
jgi:polar amino acid transport system substrate-binding protein